MLASFVRCRVIGQLPVVFKRFLLDIKKNFFMEKFCQTLERPDQESGGFPITETLKRCVDVTPGDTV